MSKFIIILIAILLVPYYLPCQVDFYSEYDLTRVSSNFNGSAFNDEHIVVYGDAGVLLISNDRGNNWDQIDLNDSLNIVDMVAIDNDFYAISDNRYLIRSKDNIRNWIKTDLGLGINFHRIFHYQDKIYIISDNKILCYNRDLAKLKEYNYSVDIKYYDACLANNKIVYVSGNGRLKYLNLDNEKSGVIELSAYDICTDCPVPNNLTSDQQNLIFFTIDNELFQIDLDANISQDLCQVPMTVNSPFASFGTDIFQIYTKTNQEFKTDSLYFGKADKVNKSFLEIKAPGNYRYIDGLAINDLKLISKDILIAVGKDKLIYMSFDCGISWELKSLINDFSYVFLFDSSNARMIAPKGKFISTKNGGTTWMPQKNYHPVFVKNINFRIKSFKAIPYFHDTNNGFIYGESFNSSIDTNIIFTTDGGETVGMKKIKNLQHFNGETYPLYTSYKSNPIFITQRSFPSSPFYAVFDIFNQNGDITSRKYIKDTVLYCIFNINDRFYSVGRDFNQESPYTYKLYHSNDTSFNWIEDFSFKIDSVFWTYSFYSANCVDDNILISWSFTKIINKDTINNVKIYNIDTKNKTIREVYSDENYFLKAIKLNNRYVAEFQITPEYHKLLYTDNINKPFNEWNKFKFNRLTPPKFSKTESTLYQKKGLISDTLFYFVAYDSLYKKDYLFKGKLKKAVSVDEKYQTEVISNLSIQSYYPVPANDYIIFKILWNQVFDINSADFKVYNLNGETVARKEDITFTQINSYSGELELNTNRFPSGVYLFSATLNGATYSQVFLVLD